MKTDESVVTGAGVGRGGQERDGFRAETCNLCISPEDLRLGTVTADNSVALKTSKLLTD